MIVRVGLIIAIVIAFVLIIVLTTHGMRGPAVGGIVVSLATTTATTTTTTTTTAVAVAVAECGARRRTVAGDGVGRVRVSASHDKCLQLFPLLCVHKTEYLI